MPPVSDASMDLETVIITGASGGLGAALARRLAGPDRFLVLLGRDAAKLSQVEADCRTKGASCQIVCGDLLDRQSLIGPVNSAIGDRPVDLLILNAGIMAGRGPDQVIETPDTGKLVLQTNLLATIDLLHTFLPGMLARRRGQIAMISSLAGLFPLPDAMAYSASKAGMIAYGLALREAVISQGVHVSVVCPGYVSTPLIANHRGFRLWEMPADKAATRILAGLKRDRAVIGFPGLLFHTARGFYILPEVLRRLGMETFRFHIG